MSSHICIGCGVELVVGKNTRDYILAARHYRCLDCYRKVRWFSDRETRGRLQMRAKIKVIKHYSNGTMACVNPFGEHRDPYTNLLVLTIDHIDGQGAKHRRAIRNQEPGRAPRFHFYMWLIRNGFPEGFQVLCMNCNWLKRFKNKEGIALTSPYVEYFETGKVPAKVLAN